MKAAGLGGTYSQLSALSARRHNRCMFLLIYGGGERKKTMGAYQLFSKNGRFSRSSDDLTVKIKIYRNVLFEGWDEREHLD